MIRHVEVKNLGGSGDEKSEQVGVLGETTFEAVRQSLSNRAETAEGNDRDRAGKSLIPRLEALGARKFVEHVIQPDPAAQDIRDRPRGHPPGADAVP
jgi:hypothetical protein